MLSCRNPDVSETSSRGARVPKTLKVRPVVTIPVLLVNAIGITYVFCTLLTNLTLVVFCTRMDCLPPETQEQLKKMSSTRLIVKLGKTVWIS